MERTDITIVGAGVVGLAVAVELSRDNQNIFVIEKNESFGQEISSRNSEVIHTGIYYPRDSLKAKTCIEGKRLLYEFCREYKIAHRKLGKLVVAIDDTEIQDLERLFERGLRNGVNDLRLMSKDEIRKLEPSISAEAAIYSPSTGILDTHSFMKSLTWQFKGRNGQIAYHTELTGCDKKEDGFELTVKDNTGDTFKFLSRILINCAGLYADKVALMAGIEDEGYKLKYCKGDYFRVHNNKGRFIARLIYPVPKEDKAGLGIHATLDLTGGMRLGPDDEYVDNIDYNMDASKKVIFYESVRKFLPFIEPQDLAPDTSGIRPKLQGLGEGFRDFLIREESERGLKGLINLIGIESPGLTSALSIAKIVRNLIT